MPATRGKSALAAHLGTRLTKAVKEHRDEETTNSGGGRLPGGISQGVAQLEKLYTQQVAKGKKNAGEFMVLGSAIVQEPKEYQGMHTRIIIPLYDTGEGDKAKSLGDYVDDLFRLLRSLGTDTKGADEGDLEGLMAATVEAEPYFKFYTTESPANPPKYPQPRVWENWGEQVPDYSPDDSEAVEDHSNGQAAAKGKSSKSEDDDLYELAKAADDSDDEEAKNKLNGHCKLFDIDPEDKKFKTWKMVVDAISKASEKDTDKSEEAEDDLEALGVAADDEDATDQDEAQTKLTELAEEKGLDPNDFDTWAELADKLLAGDGDDEADSDAPEEGGVMYYTPPKGKKRVEVEIKKVFTGKETANVMDLADNKSYKGVAFSELFKTPK